MSSSSASTSTMAKDMQTKDTLDVDLGMILQVTSLIDILQRRPIERIAPYAEHCRLLLTHFESLWRRLDVEEGSRTGAVKSIRVYKTLRHQQAAAEALQYAIRSIPSVLTAITAIKDIDKAEGHWFEQDLRIAHLQPIHRLRGCKDSQTVLAHDRLLLVLSCHSLAQDFRSFEKSNGWIPKEDQLIERISSNQNPSTQSIGKHLQNFLSSLSSLLADRERMDAGVRFGTKLRVLDAMSDSFGVGSGLSLLLGFEYQKCSRLSYNAFDALKQTLESNLEQRRSIQKVSEVAGLWFRECLAHYHQLYSSTSAELSPRTPRGLQVTPDFLWGESCFPVQHQEAALPLQTDILSMRESVPARLTMPLIHVVEDNIPHHTHETHPIDSFASSDTLCNDTLPCLTSTNYSTQDILNSWTLDFCSSEAALFTDDGNILPSQMSNIATTTLLYPLPEDLMQLE